MYKMNFVSNPRITVFLMDKDDTLDLTPDQIPDIIIPALTKACRNEVIISCSIFVKEDYGDCVHALITLWDGVCVMQKSFKLFGDGSWDIVKKDGHVIWNQI